MQAQVENLDTPLLAFAIRSPQSAGCLSADALRQIPYGRKQGAEMLGGYRE